MRRLALSTVVALLLVGALAANAGAQATPPPPPTEGERAAAFPPDLQGHAVHDGTLNFMVLFDQLEWQRSGVNGAIWDTKTWVGGDVNRIWLRSEGDVQGGTVEDAEAHLMLGRAVSRWWDVVAGVRQDFAPGTGRTWAALGIQGLAPQWFEVEATAYLGESARTAVRLEVEYELLLTNRLVVQPLLEVNVFGKADPEREVGAGLSTVEVGARLRYEIKRELAPYVGLVWHRKVFATGDLAREHGGDAGGWRLVSGLRVWF
ncbi:MAG: copper resistance protein B [Vicinamibacterales bacterium]|jgi:copper resistance protein B